MRAVKSGPAVGRIGTLAVAFGIGTAIATGLSCAVCQADDGGSGSSSAGPANTSSSHSATGSTAADTSRSSRKTTGPSAAGRATSATSGSRATHRAPAVRAVTTSIHTEPDATPSSPTTSPPVASASIAPALTTPLSSVSDTAPDSTPTLPADTLAAMGLGSTRRSKAAMQAAATSAKTTATASTSSTTTPTMIELEQLTLSPSGSGRVVTDSKASGGQALALTSTGSASSTVSLPASSGLVIRARATLSSGSPNMTLSVDGVPVTTVVISSTSWSDYTFAGTIPAGNHVLTLSTSNSTSNRTLFLDKVTTTTGSIGDEFLGSAGSAPNSSIWSVKTGTGWDPGVENYSTSNVALDGQGHLVIQAVKSRSRNSYTSGWVETKNKMSLGYGTITARIQVPKGQGLWPAFWLKGADEDTTAWPQSGEIDVLELPSTTTTIYSTLHGPIAGTTATQQAQVIGNLPDLSTGYHNFWVTHLPDKITFGVDDVTLGTLTPDSLAPGSTWVYNRPMQVILNLAVGGPWAGAPNSSTKFPAKMYVDYIRWDPVTAV